MIRFEDGWQSYVWQDGDSVTLVDTGASGCGAEIEEALGQLGLSRDEVDRVVLTHFHDDHVGSAAEIAGRGRVRILAHARDAPIIRGDRSAPRIDFVDDDERALHERVAHGLRPAPAVRVDQELHDGDVIGSDAQVVAAPGHTDGSIGLYLPAEGVLFTGDTVAHFENRVVLGPFDLDRDRAMASFRVLAELDADIACFGHGDPVVGGASASLRSAAGLPTT